MSCPHNPQATSAPRVGSDRDCKVVHRIHAERRDELEPTAGQQNWRHRLMTLRHDPLKQAR
ncbi:hypothetical protein GBQ13_02515 [Mycobacterium avium subsp. hominissuis]|nr:hypothetical protein [Mycobacterium avium subsp. hominissuis]QBC84728.1 hypothetical protein B6K05_008530 [Mycobacterium avium subsp. hominissuis]